MSKFFILDLKASSTSCWGFVQPNALCFSFSSGNCSAFLLFQWQFLVTLAIYFLSVLLSSISIPHLFLLFFSLPMKYTGTAESRNTANNLFIYSKVIGPSSCFQFEATMNKTMETIDYKQEQIKSLKLYPNILHQSNIQ